MREFYWCHLQQPALFTSFFNENFFESMIDFFQFSPSILQLTMEQSWRGWGATSLLQLLLGSQVAGVSTLLLAAVVRTWVQTGVAPGSKKSWIGSFTYLLISISHTFLRFHLYQISKNWKTLSKVRLISNWQWCQHIFSGPKIVHKSNPVKCKGSHKRDVLARPECMDARSHWRITNSATTHSHKGSHTKNYENLTGFLLKFWVQNYIARIHGFWQNSTLESLQILALGYKFLTLHWHRCQLEIRTETLHITPHHSKTQRFEEQAGSIHSQIFVFTHDGATGF